MSDGVKLCKDCKHFGEMFYSCLRGKRQVGINLVTGSPEYEFTVNEAASTQRASITPWNCGKKARYFEPKVKA